MYEELMNHEEVRRSIELERYFVVLPAFTSHYRGVKYEYPDVVSAAVTTPYNSANEKPLRKEELLEFLKKNGLLEEEEEERPKERYWPNGG